MTMSLKKIALTVTAVSRGISSALPQWAAEFTKFAAEFTKFAAEFVKFVKFLTEI